MWWLHSFLANTLGIDSYVPHLNIEFGKILKCAPQTFDKNVPPQTFWLKCAPSNNLTLMHRWKTKKNKEKWWFTHFRRKLSFVVITSFLGGTFWSNVVSGGTKTFYRTGGGRVVLSTLVLILEYHLNMFQLFPDYLQSYQPFTIFLIKSHPLLGQFCLL